MVTRRDTLRISISALPLGIAGCVGNNLRQSTTPTEQDPTSPTSSPKPFDPLDYVDEWHEEPVRAMGDPIEATQELESSQPLDTACNSLATDTVRNRVQGWFADSSGISGGRGRIDHPEFDIAVYIHRRFIIKRDGTPRSMPKVSFDRLLEVTPRSIRATVRFENQTHTCEFPVFLEDVVLYEE